MVNLNKLIHSINQFYNVTVNSSKLMTIQLQYITIDQTQYTDE